MIRRRKPRTPRYGEGHVFELLTGHDFFNDGFAGDIERMRLAWSEPDVRERVYKKLEARRRRGSLRQRPWAEEQFGIERTE